MWLDQERKGVLGRHSLVRIGKEAIGVYSKVSNKLGINFICKMNQLGFD